LEKVKCRNLIQEFSRYLRNSLFAGIGDIIYRDLRVFQKLRIGCVGKNLGNNDLGRKMDEK